MAAGTQPARSPAHTLSGPGSRQQQRGSRASESAGPASLRAPTAGSRAALFLMGDKEEGVLEDGWGLQRTTQTLSISQLFPES